MRVPRPAAHMVSMSEEKAQPVAAVVRVLTRNDVAGILEVAPTDPRQLPDFLRWYEMQKAAV
jgi:hypothetical protein